MEADMTYDYTFQIDHIDYGVVEGGNRIVLIKTGLGSDYFGYENKYLTMAFQLRDQYGFSVLVASNPHDGRRHTRMDQQALEQCTADLCGGSPELYFFGHSNGGIKGLELTSTGISFKKMVLVNMPLMINFHKTKRYISAIPQTTILAIFGEQDPSVSYAPFLERAAENVRVLTIPQADHTFRGMTNEFIGLSEWLMERKMQ
jgi:predicted esterase